jgi:alpha-tubulin suppressor-like RCC1 family protein
MPLFFKQSCTGIILPVLKLMMVIMMMIGEGVEADLSASCAIGSYSANGFEPCNPCPVGSTTATIGSTSIDQCMDVLQFPIAAGGYHTCVVMTTKDIKCWGRNDAGQLGIGSTTTIGTTSAQMSSLMPVLLGSGMGAKQVSAGALHTCALLNTGYITCWGDNSQGQLGLGISDANVGTTAASMSPLKIVNLGTTALQVAAGGYHTCALLVNYAVKCWGQNNLGQLGLGINDANVGTTAASMTALQSQSVYLGSGGVTAKQIAAGGYHTCALLSNDAVKCWGYKDWGQLGSENSDPSGIVTAVGLTLQQMIDQPNVILGAGVTAVQVSCGWQSTCVLLTSLNLKCFGDNTYGQAGVGSISNAIGKFSGEMTELTNVILGSGNTGKQAASGGFHNCVMLVGSSGSNAKCWGYNNKGQLGIGSTVTPIGRAVGDMTSLINVLLGTNVVSKMVSGMYHTCVLLSTNNVKCWGHNGYGQLGAGVATSFLGTTTTEMNNLATAVNIGPVATPAPTPVPTAAPTTASPTAVHLPLLPQSECKG